MDIVTLGAAIGAAKKNLNNVVAPVSASDAGKIATVDSNGKYQAAALTVGQGEVAVDSTLLVSGAAADAKVTGDKVAELKSAVSGIEGLVNTQKSTLHNPAIIAETNGHIYNTESTGNVLISGKNICVIDDFEQEYTSAGGVLTVKAHNGIVTINGTSSASILQVPLMSSEFAIPAGTKITISTNNTSITYNFCNRGIQSGSTRTFETTAASNACNPSRNFLNIVAGTYDNVELHLQAEIGETATTFEPFNGYVYSGGDTYYEFFGTAVVIGATITKYYVPKLISQYFVNVIDMGATGDGATDDSDALQAAITGYRKIYIPSGVYLINKTITIPSDTEIIGDGAGSIIKLGNNYSLTGYQWRETYGDDNYFYPMLITGNNTNNIVIRGIHIVGNTTAEDEHIQTGLCLYHVTRSIIDNVYIEKVNYFPENSLPRPSGQWRRGWNLSMFYAENVNVSNSLFEYASYENVRVGDYSKNVCVHDCVIKYGWRTGLQILKGCDSITVERCQIIQDDFDAYDTEACMTLHSAEDEPITNVLIKDCSLIGSLYEPGTGSGQGISFIDKYTNNIEIRGCKIIVTGTSNGIGAWGNNISVIGCVISCDGNGIQGRLDNDDAVFVAKGNRITCDGIGIYTSGDKIVRLVVADNIVSSENNGVYIDNHTEFPGIITGNIISATDKTGIMTTSNCGMKNGVITGNVILSGAYGVRGASLVDTIIANNNWKSTTTGTTVDAQFNLIVNNL